MPPAVPIVLCVYLCTCVGPSTRIVQAQKMRVPPRGGWEIAFPGLRLSNFQGKPCRRHWSLGLEGLSPPLPLDAASRVSRAIPPFLWVSCGQGCRQWVALAWAPPQTGTCWDASCLGCRCFFSPPYHLQVYSQFQNTTSSRAPSELLGSATAPPLRTLGQLGSGLVLPSYQSVILGKARTLLGSSPCCRGCLLRN